MLVDAKLPQQFWAECLSTAVFLRNQSSTSTLSGMTPFEAWNGRKPNVNELRVFGCAAYSHIPKDERKKLNPKAKRCIFLGYGEVTKGFRLYDPITSRVIHSRDVVFDETSLGFEKEQMKETEGVDTLAKFAIELDSSTEEESSLDEIGSSTTTHQEVYEVPTVCEGEVNSTGQAPCRSSRTRRRQTSMGRGSIQLKCKTRSLQQ